MRSLTLKLTLAFVLVCVLEAVLVGLLARQATLREFNRFLREEAAEEMAEDALAHYQEVGTWEGIREAMRPSVRRQRGRQLPARGHPVPRPQSPESERRPDSGGQPPQRLAPSGHFILVDQERRVLLPTVGYRIGDTVDDATLTEGLPIVAEGVVVGRVLIRARNQRFGAGEVRYLARINNALLVAAGGALLVALLLGFFFARTYTRPLRQLTRATRAMAQGDLKQQVSVRAQDEVGDLADAFNQMSADLAEANALRRQMAADIAHDLRTPLTVLSGYLEAMRDGSLQPTPERFAMMHDEAAHLNRLIADLRTLSLADAGELSLYKAAVAPHALLERTAASFTRQAKNQEVTLNIDPEAKMPTIQVDFERMVQVLGNLVSNALRFTPEGGRIILAARAQGGAVQLSVRDTGTGISPEVLPFVFKRFYRADAARTQENGESGLGLAIARSIVEAHSGTIRVESEIGQGTTFTITVPVEPDEVVSPAS